MWNVLFRETDVFIILQSARHFLEPSSFVERTASIGPSWPFTLPLLFLLSPTIMTASTPYETSTHCPPQHDDLMYVTHQLWSGSQQDHTRRFSYENPTWPDEDGYLFDIPLLRYHTQDDDATTANSATRTQSQCSQTTLCGSLSPAQQKYTTPPKSSSTVAAFPRLPQYPHDKALPPTPSTGRPDSPSSLRWFEDFPTRSRKCSLTGSSISSPICTTQGSSPLRNAPAYEPFPSVGDRVHSWPTFVAQREAPKPLVVEEKSVFESDSEDETKSDTLRRIRRRISNPLRTFLCSAKEPRRQSA